mgnify:CR=1 FL=1
MSPFGIVLVALLAVVASGLIGRVTRLPVPLVQMALGAALSMAGLALARFEPETFFLLYLAPLLFLDGWRIPKDALFRDASTILTLALGLVAFTVLGMGLFIHALVPALPLAVAFALAAVISPTDPVAVSAIAARTPIPPRLLHVLQGEALLNDASGLVCMRFAVAAAVTGSFSLPQALASFAWLALGGLAVGAAVTLAVARLASWASAFGEDGGAQILVTLLMPFAVYLLAERLHCSGLLAVVAAGITMSLTDVWPWSASTRLRRTAVWDTVQFAVNGSIFVLLGEQIPALVAAAPVTVQATGHTAAAWLLVDVVLIVAALAVLRFAWVGVSLKLRILGRRRRGDPPLDADWRVVLVASLCGVRGAVTLAGVMTLPLLLGDGTPFPGRDLAIALAAGVILLSLVLASATLPHALRGLARPASPAAQTAEDKMRRAAAEAAIAAVRSAATTLGAANGERRRHDEAAARIVALYRAQIERLDRPAPAAMRERDDRVERRLRRVGLRAERHELLRYGREHHIADLTLRGIVRELDLLETHHGG